MSEILPAELIAVINGLPSGWELESFKRYDSFSNWEAEVRSPALAHAKSRRFILLNDRGYFDVYEVMPSKKQIMPPDELRESISPSQVCQLLVRANSD
jgi:hypothetical protein